jgi:hypothetical protein
MRPTGEQETWEEERAMVAPARQQVAGRFPGPRCTPFFHPRASASSKHVVDWDVPIGCYTYSANTEPESVSRWSEGPVQVTRRRCSPVVMRSLYRVLGDAAHALPPSCPPRRAERRRIPKHHPVLLFFEALLDTSQPL